MSSTQTIPVRDLRGMDQRFSPALGTAEEINDMRRDPLGSWRTCGGWGSITAVGAITEEVYTLAWFAQHQGARRWFVWEERSAAGSTTATLKYMTPTTGAANTLQTLRKLFDGPWIRTEYMQVGNWLYIINGYDLPQRWDGRLLAQVGFTAPPPAPKVVGPLNGFGQHDLTQAIYNAGGTGDHSAPLTRGVGIHGVAGPPILLSETVYGYCYTRFNDVGMESEPSPLTFIKGRALITTGTSRDYPRQCNRMTIEPAGELNARATRIYRTINVFDVDSAERAGFPVYFHSEHLHAGKITLVDETPDSELGPQLITDGLGSFPNSARLMCVFKNTLFVAGMSESPSVLRYSTAGRIEQMPAQNTLTVGENEGGEITGLFPTRNALVVFKRRGIYLVKGDPGQGFGAPIPLTEAIGSASPKAMVEIPGQGLLFLSDAGPYLLVGALEDTGTPTEVAFLGAGIARLWEREVNVAHLVTAQGALNYADREIWIQVPQGGDWRPKLGLVYSFETGDWSVRRDWPINCFATATHPRHKLFFGSWDTTLATKGIFHYSPGYTDKAGVTVQGTYLTSWIDFGERAHVLAVVPLVVGHGAGRALTMNWRKDWEVDYRATRDEGFTQSTSEAAEQLWGVATWSASSVWQDYPLTRVRASLDQANQFHLQVRFRGTRMRVSSYELDVVPGKGATSIKNRPQGTPREP
jgi:hypothetical protein